jgi:DNA-binding CsgD family transcriptional regulator
MSRTSGEIPVCTRDSRDVTPASAFAVDICVLNVFESFGYGGFLLDRRRRVFACNRIAANCLGAGLMLRDKCLAAAHQDSDARLQSLIASALKSVDGPDRPVSVGIRRHFRLPLVVSILPLSEERRPALNSAKLLLAVSDPEFSHVPTVNMLTDMFGLTPTEAGVAIGIASGKQLVQIAADRGIKIETVRVHLKVVFSKTQTRGQPELAALLTRLASLIPYRGGTSPMTKHSPPQL